MPELRPRARRPLGSGGKSHSTPRLPHSQQHRNPSQPRLELSSEHKPARHFQKVGHRIPEVKIVKSKPRGTRAIRALGASETSASRGSRGPRLAHLVKVLSQTKLTSDKSADVQTSVLVSVLESPVSPSRPVPSLPWLSPLGHAVLAHATDPWFSDSPLGHEARPLWGPA